MKATTSPSVSVKLYPSENRENLWEGGFTAVLLQQRTRLAFEISSRIRAVWSDFYLDGSFGRSFMMIEYFWGNGSRDPHQQWSATVLYRRAAAATRTVPTLCAGGGKRIYKWEERRGDLNSPLSCQCYLPMILQCTGKSITPVTCT